MVYFQWCSLHSHVVLPTVSVAWRSHDGLVESRMSSTSRFKQSFLKDNDGWLIDAFSICPAVCAQMMDYDAWTSFLGNANESSALALDEGVEKSASMSLVGHNGDKPES
jgi:hypothetical protein